jgi:AcrR family transcriptional regulator
MPALAKTSDDEIAAAARALFEHQTAEFSMAAVAEATGIRAPSLYKRFADRDALLSRVRRDAYRELGTVIAAADRGASDRARLRSMALAYRAYASQHPRLYALLFSPDENGDPATQEARAGSAAPVLKVLGRAIGAARALDAARTVTAFLHGHISMLQAGAFHLGGDVEAAFRYGLDRVLDGILRSEK